MQKKVFITGGTGLVGARLIFELYHKGYSITALIRKKASINNLTKTLRKYTNNPNQIIEAINWIYGDVLDEQKLHDVIEPNVDVYHCAAMVSFNPKKTKQLVEVNVQGTANMVNACIEKKVRKFCHVSSIGALGTPVTGLVTDIDSPWSTNGKSPYSVSKHNSELEVWRGIAEGLNAVIVNPAVILGAGNWDKSSAALFSKIEKGMKYYTLGSTGYVYVTDVVTAMVKLMESDISGQRFILSTETLSFKEMFEKIARALNVKAPKKRANKFLTAFAWRFEEQRTRFSQSEPLISRYSHKTAHSISDYNGKPITETIEFNYTNIDKAVQEIAKLYNE